MLSHPQSFTNRILILMPGRYLTSDADSWPVMSVDLNTPLVFPSPNPTSLSTQLPLSTIPARHQNGRNQHVPTGRARKQRLSTHYSTPLDGARTSFHSQKPLPALSYPRSRFAPEALPITGPTSKSAGGDRIPGDGMPS